MGLFKRVKKAINRTVRKVENFGHRVIGKPEIGEKDPMDSIETGARSTAAQRLIKTTQKQAGGGQIKYNTEETT